jgi:8-oxo-dGTP diphosphatase
MSLRSDKNYIHVVIGVILNKKQECLLSRRKLDAHLGGLLEFPGGKVEEQESAENALRRELLEEVGIFASSFTPLIQIPYSYADRDILLNVFLVDAFTGSLEAQEGQEVFWKSIASLKVGDFPAANFGVLRALQLPKIFPITPNYSIDPENYLISFEKILCRKEIHIIQLRSHELDDSEYLKLAKNCADLCKKYNVTLVFNRQIEILDEINNANIHLTSCRLLETTKKPSIGQNIVGASCHNLNEVQHANVLGLDYIILGPVIEKSTVAKSISLGWDGFAELAKAALMPVYAIGGLGINDESKCVMSGGQGIAAIRGVWGVSD